MYKQFKHTIRLHEITPDRVRPTLGNKQYLLEIEKGMHSLLASELVVLEVWCAVADRCWVGISELTAVHRKYVQTTHRPQIKKGFQD